MKVTSIGSVGASHQMQPTPLASTFPALCPRRASVATTCHRASHGAHLLVCALARSRWVRRPAPSGGRRLLHGRGGCTSRSPASRASSARAGPRKRLLACSSPRVASRKSPLDMQIVRFSTLLRIALPAHHRQAFSRSARSRAHATPPRVRSPAAPGACFAWAARTAVRPML